LFTRKNFRRDVDSTGKYQLESAHHHLALAGLGNESDGAKVKRLAYAMSILCRREDNNGNSRVLLSQFGQDGEPVPVRQIKVEQNEPQISVLSNDLHRLPTVRGFE
jgi:hypothetical protein